MSLDGLLGVEVRYVLGDGAQVMTVAPSDAPPPLIHWRVRPLQAQDYDRWRELRAGYAAFY